MKKLMCSGVCKCASKKSPVKKSVAAKAPKVPAKKSVAAKAPKAPVGEILLTLLTIQPTRKNTVFLEIEVDDAYARVSEYVFDRLQSEETPITGEEISRLLMPFGGPNLMREALRDPMQAVLILGDNYDEIADRVNARDPLVIVLRKGDKVWAVACPYEDVH
ncbi:MAG: hypothetical protein PHW03_08940 [Eubacteriales bacterium]|nr:hypothetical protein [Eubacteriales bacterium]